MLQRHGPFPWLALMPVLLCNQGVRTTVRGAAVAPGQRAAHSLTISHRPARKGRGGGAATTAQSATNQVERAVVNCLMCGKIFHPFAESADSRYLVGKHPQALTHSSMHMWIMHQ